MASNKGRQAGRNYLIPWFGSPPTAGLSDAEREALERKIAEEKAAAAAAVAAKEAEVAAKEAQLRAMQQDAEAELEEKEAKLNELSAEVRAYSLILTRSQAFIIPCQPPG